MSPRRYNYEVPADAETIKWMKAQARREGKTYGQWCTDNGIMSEWAEKKANREIPESFLGPRAMAVIDNRISLQEYNGETPGGPQVASILLDSKSKNKVSPPKRPRGRPRKRYIHAED